MQNKAMRIGWLSDHRQKWLAPLAFSLVLFQLASCQSVPEGAGPQSGLQNGPQSGQSPGEPDPQLALLSRPRPEISPQSSNWLVAQQALKLNDLATAAEFFSQALTLDRQNESLLTQSFLSFYQNGQIEDAAVIAGEIEARGLALPLVSEPAAAIAVRDNDWQAVQVLAENLRSFDSGRPLAELLDSWALLAQGQHEAGLAKLTYLADQLADDSETEAGFLQLHIAIALEYAGQNQDAREIALGLADQGGWAARLTLQLAGALWRLGEAGRAETLLQTLSPAFDRAHLSGLLQAGQLDVAAHPDPARALAAAILDLSWFWQSRQNRQLLLPRVHLVLYIDPENSAARFVLGQLLENLEDNSLSTGQLEQIGPASGWDQPGFLLRIDQLHQAENWPLAEQLISQRIRNHPDNARLRHVMGDHYRYRSDWTEAAKAYEKARQLGDGSASLWRNLGVCYEQMGDDGKAETALQKAIELNPEDAWALNYLGYWWADENRNLDEAIDLIERAVALRPDSGAFADSLGWVFYRLGQFERAVEWLEKAHRLEPGDPVISDHLGDVYWQLGRPLEARFKWQLALDLEPDNDLADIVSQKLEKGLETGK